MVTLKDVAKRTGLTVTTVSRVLNNRGYISEKARNKVYEAIRELDYHPNELARSLTKQRTSIIGVIVPSVMHPFFSEVVNYLESYAVQHNYKIMLCNSYRQKEKEIEYINMLKSNRVSGIVLCSRTEDIESYLDTRMPVVSFERDVSSDISFISCDNYQGGQLATKHLIDRGCRRLVHIGGARDMHMPADRRGEAFLKVCEEHDVEAKVYYTDEAQLYTMEYEECIERILLENRGVDGIFASSDVIAAEAIHACAKLGIRIPEEMRLVGFDDIRLASLTTPKITTIRQPIEQMSDFAIRTIVKQAEMNAAPSRTTLAVRLIKRETT